MPEEPKGVEKVSSGNASLDEAREKHPNMGRAWSKDDDALLTAMFNEEKPRKGMAEHFGRKPSAITARLAHLGLIENTWKGFKKNDS